MTLDPQDAGPGAGYDALSPEPSTGPCEAAAVAAENCGPWGFWPTVGLSLAVMAVYSIAQVLMVIGYGAVRAAGDPDIDMVRLAESMKASGLFLAVIVCAAAPLGIGLTLAFARARKGITIPEYLGLRRVGPATIAKWSLVTLLSMGVLHVIAGALERPVSEFMLNTYDSEEHLGFVLVTFVIVVPVFEELLFRGFMFKGIQLSRLGAAGAIVITSLVWAALHVQYDIYNMAAIFVFGLVFGMARQVSGSTYVPFAMHLLLNLVASVQVIAYLNQAA